METELKALNDSVPGPGPGGKLQRASWAQAEKSEHGLYHYTRDLYCVSVKFP